MENGLFSCVGVGVLDVGREEVVEEVREVVVEVGAVELVELTELWLNVDETDEAAGLDTDRVGDGLG
jgi:Zn finger protein HypA/HybF involved in hydrogenase expression